jgi:hypothetical protein
LKIRRNTLRNQDLQTENEQESAYKRVRAEAIDFDWIFKGSPENDNAVNMIKLLSSQERTQLFITRSVRVFIELMWAEYQPAIVKKVFYPFCLYLLVLVFLSSYVGGDMLDILIDPNQNISATTKIITLVSSVMAVFGWMFFAKSEIN